MRAVIRHSQGKRGAEEAYVHHNGNSSGLASTVLNGNSFGGGGSVGMPDHVRLQNDGRSIKAEDTDKGGGSIGVGGSGGIEVKTEPMEFEFSGRTSYVVSRFIRAEATILLPVLLKIELHNIVFTILF